jgi:hypothetical protein
VLKRSTPVQPATVGHAPDSARGVTQARRARAAFWILTIAGAGLGAAIASTWTNPLLGLGVGAVAGAVLGAVTSLLVTVWPVVRLVWHWLAEILTVALLVGSLVAVAAVTGSWWWTTGFLVPLGAAAVLRPVRRRVMAVVWCAIVRHRLRVCFAAFIRARNHLDPGLTPLILLARPTPAGERVWVWLRAGLSVEDLEQGKSKVAVACWASDVQVSATRRFAALVRMDVTRRDPLRLLVASPLASAVPGQRRQPAAASVDLSTLALDLDDVAEESVTSAKAGVTR